MFQNGRLDFQGFRMFLLKVSTHMYASKQIGCRREEPCKEEAAKHSTGDTWESMHMCMCARPASNIVQLDLVVEEHLSIAIPTSLQACPALSAS